MPSGAKKRKAAKKKKEKETEVHTNIPQGNDEVKSQDEKGSDGGEGGSPSHGDHDHAFNEEVKERDPPAATAAASSKDLDEVPTKTDETQGGKEDVVVIEWDMKSEESCENKEASVGHAESAKESDHVNGNSVSSNEEAVTMKKTKDQLDNSLKDTVAHEESIDSSHAKMTSIAQNEQGEETGKSGAESIAQNAQVEEAGKSGAQSSVDSVKAPASVSEVKTGDAENILAEKSMDSQVGGTDLAVKKNEDKVHGFSDQNVTTSSLEEPKPKEFDREASASVSRSPLPESTIGTENVKNSDIPECSENKPLVASSPHMVQKTSWLNCCGLFEVFSGSNR